MTQQEVLQICSSVGLPNNLADELQACVHVESEFNQYAIHLNTDGNGGVLSIDYGICQINDYWHIGTGKDFPTPEYVLSNPTACIKWMAKLFMEGQQKLWVSYTSGLYKQYLMNPKD